jgi:hypothetical protein
MSAKRSEHSLTQHFKHALGLQLMAEVAAGERKRQRRMAAAIPW